MPTTTTIIPFAALMSAANTPPTLSGTVANQAVTDAATILPFATVMVVDPDVGQTETVTVTYAAANGTLAGGGFAGAAGSYSGSFASASSAQAALQLLAFTPTAHQVAPGATVATAFNVAVSDGLATVVNTGASVIATSVNDPPTISGLARVQGASAGSAVTPFAAATITDPDTGQTETVTVTFVPTSGPPGGDQSVIVDRGGVFTGAGFTGSGGSYSGVFASAAAAQAALRSATFTPLAGTVAADTLTVTVQDGPGGAATPVAAVTTVAVSTFAGQFNLPFQGTVPNLAVTDQVPVSPFAGVALNASGYTPGYTTPVIVTVTDNAGANGTLAGGGFVQTAPGVYKFTLVEGPIADNFTAAVAALQALVFTPTANQVAVGATVATAFTVTVSGGGFTIIKPTTVVAASVNDPPTVSGLAAVQVATAGTSLSPFAAATIADPDVGQTETVTVGVAGGTGVFAGAGFTGSGGSYGGTFASAAAAQAALRAATFTPAAGMALADTLTVSVQDGPGGAATPTVASTTLAVASTPQNTAPTILGTLGGQPVVAGSPINPFATTVITDPDAGQTERVTVSFSAANGTLSGGGFQQTAPGVYSVTVAAGGAGVSAAGAQADLRAAVFTPAAGQAATTNFTLTVSDGMTSVSDGLTSVIATYTPPVVAPPASPLSVQSGFSTNETANLLRAAVNGVDATTPGTPVYGQVQAEKAIAAQLDTGQLSLAQAESALDHVADGTTGVAVASYAFFTGYTPTAAGLNYLVHSTANATNLDSAYYAQFSTENRYINFAVNLATGAGAGAAAFQANYALLSLVDATTKAYLTVFGTAPDATKVAALLNALVPDGLGGQETRAAYFAQYGGDGLNGQGTKAAMIGFLLSNAVHDGSGVYGAATENYLAAIAHGSAPVSGSELALHYGAAVSLVGTTVLPDPTITG